MNNVGHAHPRVAEAISKQAHKLIHTSNIYYIEEQVRLAKQLVEISPHQKPSSAIVEQKPMREQLNWRENSLAKEILLLWKTVSMVEPSPPSLLPASTNIKGIRPLPPGFSHVPYGNLEVVEDAITEKQPQCLWNLCKVKEA